MFFLQYCFVVVAEPIVLQKSLKNEEEEDDFPEDLQEEAAAIITKLMADNGPCKAAKERVPPVVKFLTQFCDLWKPNEKDDKKEKGSKPDEKQLQNMTKEFESMTVNKQMLTGLFVTKKFNRNLPPGHKFTKTFTAILQAYFKTQQPDFSDHVLVSRDEWNGVRIKPKFASELNNQKILAAKSSSSSSSSASSSSSKRKRKYESQETDDTEEKEKQPNKTVKLPWDIVRSGDFYFIRITAPYCHSQDIMCNAKYIESKMIIQGMYTVTPKLPGLLIQNYRLTSYNMVVGSSSPLQQAFYTEIMLPQDVDLNKTPEFGEVDSGVIITFHRLSTFVPPALSMPLPLQLSSRIQTELIGSLPPQYPNPSVFSSVKAEASTSS